MVSLMNSLVNNQSYAFTQKADISLYGNTKMDSFIHPSATPTDKNKRPIQGRTFISLLTTERTLPQQQKNTKRTSIFKNKM